MARTLTMVLRVALVSTICVAARLPAQEPTVNLSAHRAESGVTVSRTGRPDLRVVLAVRRHGRGAG